MRWFIILLLVFLPIALTACDPAAGITWVNETGQTVDVYLGEDLDDFDGSLPPHSSTEADTIKAVWEDIVVLRDKEGTVLFRQELTWDELAEQDFRFEITEEMLSSTPDKDG